jgi:CRISPR-associated protein Cmr3
MPPMTFKITPVDSWFFRDGRPFNLGETHSDLKSLFPPFGPTIVGAIRASLARDMGWNGKGSWNGKIKRILGDGQRLGDLRFKGPYLIRMVDNQEEMLFPAPLHLLGQPPKEEDGQWSRITKLIPGKGVDCDLGDDVRLPRADNTTGLKSLYGCYLNAKDFRKVLEGVDLCGIAPIAPEQLWNFDFSVGIKRKFETRTAENGALYSAYRVRLRPGVGLAVQLDGLGAEIKVASTMPLGGESRMANVEILKEQLSLPVAPETRPSDDGKTRFAVIHLTPGYFEGNWPGPGEVLSGISGVKVVSACMERPVRIGGWDSLNKEPMPLRPFLPPGTTWFCEAETCPNETIQDLHGHHIGRLFELGFGQIVIGSWN